MSVILLVDKKFLFLRVDSPSKSFLTFLEFIQFLLLWDLIIGFLPILSCILYNFDLMSFFIFLFDSNLKQLILSVVFFLKYLLWQLF